MSVQCMDSMKSAFLKTPTQIAAPLTSVDGVRSKQSSSLQSTPRTSL